MLKPLLVICVWLLCLGALVNQKRLRKQSREFLNHLTILMTISFMVGAIHPQICLFWIPPMYWVFLDCLHIQLIRVNHWFSAEVSDFVFYSQCCASTLLVALGVVFSFIETKVFLASS